VVVSTVVYVAGLVLLAAAVLDRRRRNVDPAVAARRKNVRRQQAAIAQAGELPKQQAAQEIAGAVRALVAELPDVARDEAEAVIAACESVAYAPAATGDSRLEATLVERAVAVADRFQKSA
jgi:hypothetical protein